MISQVDPIQLILNHPETFVYSYLGYTLEHCYSLSTLSPSVLNGTYRLCQLGYSSRLQLRLCLCV